MGTLVIVLGGLLTALTFLHRVGIAKAETEAILGMYEELLDEAGSAEKKRAQGKGRDSRARREASRGAEDPPG